LHIPPNTSITQDNTLRIQVVEDEYDFADEFCIMLSRYGFHTKLSQDIQSLFQTIDEFRPNVVVLDQFVNNIDTLQYLGRIRERYSGKIMVLTANTNATDRIIGLESGADDFVIKSIDPREIVARVRALARRHAEESQRSIATPRSSTRAESGWYVDPIRREVRAPNGETIQLTGAEFDMFHLLHESPGEIVSKELLAREILERDLNLSGRSVENIISRIRNKFRPVTKDLPLIRAVRNKGYVFIGFS
jgi:two-component system OmpR family response regulator